MSVATFTLTTTFQDKVDRVYDADLFISYIYVFQIVNPLKSELEDESCRSKKFVRPLLPLTRQASCSTHSANLYMIC